MNNNKWGTLLSALTNAFGGSDAKNGKLRVLRQGYDNDKNTFFVQVEYRYERDTSPRDGVYREVKPKKQKPHRTATPTYKKRKEQNLNLLRQIDFLAKTGTGNSIPLT